MASKLENTGIKIAPSNDHSLLIEGTIGVDGSVANNISSHQHKMQFEIRGASTQHSLAIGVFDPQTLESSVSPYGSSVSASVIQAKAYGIGYDPLYLNPLNAPVCIGYIAPTSIAGTKLYVAGKTFLSGAVTTNGNISPYANNTYDLGTSSLKWKNIYATTFTGLATSADTVDQYHIDPWGKGYRYTHVVTHTTGSTPFYAKVSMPKYSRPNHIVISTDYDNRSDSAIIEFSNWGTQWIFRNNNKNNGNILEISHVGTAYNDSEWAFFFKLHSKTGGTEPAEITVYSDKDFGLTVQDAAPDNVTFTVVSGSSRHIVIKGIVTSAETASSAINDGNGKAISSSYLPISGGTMTGNLTINGDNNLYLNSSDSKNFIRLISNASGNFLQVKTNNANDGSLQIAGNGSNLGTNLYLLFENTETCNIIPKVRNGYNLGSPAKEWMTVYTRNIENVDTASPGIYIGHSSNTNIVTCYGGGSFGIGSYYADTNYKLRVFGKTKIDSSLDVGGNLTVTGATKIIENTDGTNGIKFVIDSSANRNYFQVKTNGANAGNLQITGYNAAVGGTLDLIFNTTTSRAFRPAANNTYNLGTSSFKWANVYATTFNGSLTGLATSATTLGGKHIVTTGTVVANTGTKIQISTNTYSLLVIVRLAGAAAAFTAFVDCHSSNPYIKLIGTGKYFSHSFDGSSLVVYNHHASANANMYIYSISTGAHTCTLTQNVEIPEGQEGVAKSLYYSTGGNMSGHIILNGIQNNETYTNTSQIIFHSGTTSADTSYDRVSLTAYNQLHALYILPARDKTTHAIRLGTSGCTSYFQTGVRIGSTGTVTSGYMFEVIGGARIANNLSVQKINIFGSASSTATIESDNGTNIFIRSNGVIPFVVDGNVVRRSGSATGATLGSSTHPWYGVYGGTGNFTSNVAVGGNLTIAGSVTGTAFYEGSDMAYKTDIKPLVNRGSLKPVEYTLKKTGERQLGFIAQDVQELYPELVGKNEDDKLVLNYPNLTAVLAAQNNELREEIELLKKEIEEIKAIIKK